jgi:hypothetical protein
VTCGPQKVRSISRGDLLQPMFVVQSAEHLLNSYPTIRRQFVSGMLRAWPSPSSRLWNSRTKTGMRASAIVMHNPFPQNSPQMLFVQRDQPVQARAPHASDQSFTVGIRLRRLHGGSSNFQPEGPQLVINFRGKDRIPIMNQESVGVIAREASRNCCKVQAAVGWAVRLQCRMRRLPTSITTNTYSTRKPAVSGHDGLGVIADKRPPLLRGCSPTASRIPILRPVRPHGSGRNQDPQLHRQFGGNALLAPGRVLLHHAHHQPERICR